MGERARDQGHGRDIIVMLSLLLAAAALMLTTGVAAVALARSGSARLIVYGATGLLALVMLTATILHAILSGSATETITLPIGLPWLGARFRLDPLASFFVIVADLGAAAASLYAVGYGRHEAAPHRVLPFFPLFIAGMNLVVLADDAFSFLIAWEFMSLASWALVMAHHRDKANAQAGYIYLLMASFGTLSLMLAFGLLAGIDGGYGFEQIRAHPPSSERAALVLALVLLGAGSKAGLVPLHVWLPLAHPAAPSQVSALMSGVMTKVALYAFLRVVFDLLGEPHWWWGAVILALGGVTAVMGVLYALMQHDLKRLLAYHTVENIGIIFIAFGLAIAFRANGMAVAAALALTAGLFHVFNHSVFKSLLFFGAGAVLTATGERDMEHLGGLIHRMPVTALTFLIGSAAISALPPLNGFVSEWLLFQSILVSPQLPQWVLKFLVPGVGAMLALSAALASTCFVKAFGITFLGRPRRQAAAAAHEVDGFSLAAMLALAGICVLAGVLPGLVVDGLAPAVAQLAGARLGEQAALPWMTLVPLAAERSSYNGLLLLGFIAVSASASALLIHRFASRRLRRAPAWDCGFPEPSPLTQYTAGSFAQPIRRVFGRSVFGAQEAVLMPPPGSLRPAVLRVRMHDLVWDWIYRPIAAGTNVAATRINRMQFLTIRRYLSLVFAALLILLVALVIGR